MQRLRHLTDDVFQVTPGSLFPALHSEKQNWKSITTAVEKVLEGA